jgi:hypothetical protein
VPRRGAPATRSGRPAFNAVDSDGPLVSVPECRGALGGGASRLGGGGCRVRLEPVGLRAFQPKVFSQAGILTCAKLDCAFACSACDCVSQVFGQAGGGLGRAGLL